MIEILIAILAAFMTLWLVGLFAPTPIAAIAALIVFFVLAFGDKARLR